MLVYMYRDGLGGEVLFSALLGSGIWAGFCVYNLGVLGLTFHGAV